MLGPSQHRATHQISQNQTTIKVGEEQDDQIQAFLDKYASLMGFGKGMEEKVVDKRKGIK